MYDGGPMKVLVVNVGSTSVKYNLYEMDTEARLAVGKVERIGTPDAVHVHEDGAGRRSTARASRGALARDPRAPDAAPAVRSPSRARSARSAIASSTAASS